MTQTIVTVQVNKQHLIDTINIFKKVFYHINATERITSGKDSQIGPFKISQNIDTMCYLIQGTNVAYNVTIDRIPNSDYNIVESSPLTTDVMIYSLENFILNFKDSTPIFTVALIELSKFPSASFVIPPNCITLLLLNGLADNSLVFKINSTAQGDVPWNTLLSNGNDNPVSNNCIKPTWIPFLINRSIDFFRGALNKMKC